MSEMKHTVIGDIPANWKIQTFKETFQVLPNNTFSRFDLNSSGGIIRNIHYGDILVQFPEVLDCKREDIPYLNDTALVTVNTQFLRDGDVIIADTAEDETVGKATEIYDLGNEKMVAGLHTIPCRKIKGEFVAKWLGYYMNSNVFHNQVLPYITGIKVSSISKLAIAKTYILVPPEREQEEIVSALSDIDALITHLEKLIEKFQMIKQGCLERMFPHNGQDEPEIRLPGFTGVWEQRKLGEVCQITTGKLDANAAKPDGIYTFFTCGHNTLMTDTYSFEGDAIIISGNGDLGFTRKYSGKFNAYQRTYVLQDFVEDFDYLEQAIKRYLPERLFGESLGGAMPYIKRDSLSDLGFPSPSPQEQKKIASFFYHLDHLINLYQRKLNKYKMIKQSMMDELLTGKIRLI